MKLFENEQTQIGKIYNVDKYVNSNPSAKEYGNNFRVCELIYFISGTQRRDFGFNRHVHIPCKLPTQEAPLSKERKASR